MTRTPKTPAQAAGLLWTGLPAVLLTGSALHEKACAQRAAPHGCDWLIKLALTTGIIAGRRS